MKKLILIFFLPYLIFSQQTASSFLKKASENYKSIKNFMVNVNIQTIDEGSYDENGDKKQDSKAKKTSMNFKLYYKYPNYLKGVFGNGQILFYDGKMFSIYVPKYNVTLTQSIKKSDSMNLITGLDLMVANYSVAYKNSPNPEQLSSSDGTLVTKLMLNWRNKEEGFREIELSIGSNLLIRRIIAKTSDYKTIIVDYSGYSINGGVGQVFEFDSPPNSNNFNNFLYSN